MPEEAAVVEVPTQVAKEVQATHAAAAKTAPSGVFSSPDFMKGLQDAIDKDAGKTPPAAAAATPPPPAAPADKVAPDAKQGDPAPESDPASLDDIPAEIMGEAKPPAKPKAAEAQTDATADAERQKFIEEQTKGMTPKAAERFKKIEARAAEAEKRAKAIEADLAAERAKQVEAKPENPVFAAEIERLKKQNAELEEILSKQEIQNDPRFKAKYDAAINRELTAISKYLPPEHAEEFSQLLTLPESKRRNDRLEEIVQSAPDEISKAKIRAGWVRADGLAAEKAQELSNWKENMVHVEAEKIRRQERDEAARQESLKVAWTKGLEKVSSPDSGLEVFRKAAGSEEWNQAVDSRINSAAKIISTLSSMQPEQMVEIVARSVAVDDYRRMFIAQRVLAQKLSAELAAIKSAQPNPATNGGSAPPPKSNLSYIDAVTESTRQAGILK